MPRIVPSFRSFAPSQVWWWLVLLRDLSTCGGCPQTDETAPGTLAASACARPRDKSRDADRILKRDALGISHDAVGQRLAKIENDRLALEFAEL
jgi:hypothetical protein